MFRLISVHYTEHTASLSCMYFTNTDFSTQHKTFFTNTKHFPLTQLMVSWRFCASVRLRIGCGTAGRYCKRLAGTAISDISPTNTQDWIESAASGCQCAGVLHFVRKESEGLAFGLNGKLRCEFCSLYLYSTLY